MKAQILPHFKIYSCCEVQSKRVNQIPTFEVQSSSFTKALEGYLINYFGPKVEFKILPDFKEYPNHRVYEILLTKTTFKNRFIRRSHISSLQWWPMKFKIKISECWKITEDGKLELRK